MRIGIGLPVTVPGATRSELLEWAVTAEAQGFSALSTIDRLLFPGYESLLSLAAAAAVTERVELMAALLVAPSRPNTVLLAKEALTLDALSDGRLTLAVGVGSRVEDFEAAGADFHRRGAFLDQQLDELNALWRESRIGPEAGSGPRVLIGGHSSASLRRAARSGVGWLAGGERSELLESMAAELREAWRAAGRPRAPELHAADYFALGPDAERAVCDYMGRYFAFLPDGGARIASSVPTTAAELRALRDEYEAAGVTQVLWNPCSADPRQVRLLADALSG